MKSKLLLLLIFSPFSLLWAQSDKEQALEYGKEAIHLMDRGSFEEAISLLKKAEKLDPDKMAYPYEIAYAKYVQKDYNGAIKILDKLTSHKEVNDQVYQLLGNAYDLAGKPEKAMKIYAQGREVFPNSGKLYLEPGIISYYAKKYEEAIDFWEQGIKAEPNYSSNYYWLAKIFVHSKERVWMLIYGELFINLERGTKRTEEISKLLYENYQKTYTQESDSSGEFHLTEKGFIIIAKDKKDIKAVKKGILPFEGSFAMDYSLAAILFMGVNDLPKMYETRRNFITNWFAKKHAKQYPHPLFIFHKKMKKLGFFEAYTYWMLAPGNTAEFLEWKEGHEADYEAFIEWYEPNPLELKKQELFSRKDYE